jgi:hypothetical protein
LEASVNTDAVRALADQACAAADDTKPKVEVGRDEWFALMDAIYEPEEGEDGD